MLVHYTHLSFTLLLVLLTTYCIIRLSIIKITLEYYFQKIKHKYFLMSSTLIKVQFTWSCKHFTKMMTVKINLLEN